MQKFEALLTISGLSEQEAAAYLSLDLNTLRDCLTGHRPTPADAYAALLSLVTKQFESASEAAEMLLNQVDAIDLGQIHVGVSADDHEAQSLGWPTASAHRAVINIVIEVLPPELAERIVLVPRGSTFATALTADAFGA